MEKVHGIHRDAVFSPCGRHRYVLGRRWDQEETFRMVNFIMLNPSVADTEVDDPTIRRCMGFAKRWGCNELVVTNLYPIVTEHPSVMKAAEDRLGPRVEAGSRLFVNHGYIERVARDADIVICAWGAHATPTAVNLALGSIFEAGADPHCLRWTKDGQPSHPLYLPSDLDPKPWRPRA